MVAHTADLGTYSALLLFVTHYLSLVTAGEVLSLVANGCSFVCLVVDQRSRSQCTDLKDWQIQS